MSPAKPGMVKPSLLHLSRPEPCAMPSAPWWRSRGHPPEGSESWAVLPGGKVDYARLLREQNIMYAEREAEYGKYVLNHSKKS